MSMDRSVKGLQIHSIAANSAHNNNAEETRSAPKGCWQKVTEPASAQFHSALLCQERRSEWELGWAEVARRTHGHR